MNENSLNCKRKCYLTITSDYSWYFRNLEVLQIEPNWTDQLNSETWTSKAKHRHSHDLSNSFSYCYYWSAWQLVFAKDDETRLRVVASWYPKRATNGRRLPNVLDSGWNQGAQVAVLLIFANWTVSMGSHLLALATHWRVTTFSSKSLPQDNVFVSWDGSWSSALELSSAAFVIPLLRTTKIQLNLSRFWALILSAEFSAIDSFLSPLSAWKSQ